MGRSFYIYVVFRRSGEPCYVGKGQGSRWKNHLKNSHNIHLRRIIKKDGDVPIVVIRSGLTEAAAFEIEIALIAAIGRWKNGGPLVNQTDGGEGISGFKMPAAVIQRLSERMMGRKHRLGYKASDETRAIQRALKLGVKQRPEVIEARVAPMRGKKRPSEVRRKVSQTKWNQSPKVKWTWSEEAKARQRERFKDPELRKKISERTLLANERPELKEYYENRDNDAKSLGRTPEEIRIRKRNVARERRADKFRASWESAPIFISEYSGWGDGASAGLC